VDNLQRRYQRRCHVPFLDRQPIVSYNGKIYTFEQEKGVEYGDVWNLLQFQIMPDIKLITEVVNTKNISSNMQILDLFVKVR
jgi:hypothetical protein